MPGTVPHRNSHVVSLSVSEVFACLVRPSVRPEDYGSFFAGAVVTSYYAVAEVDYAAVPPLRALSRFADISSRPFDIYAAEVEWGGVWRAILVSAVGAEALLGMRLLAGHTLRIDVVPGGVVEITPLP